VKMLGIDASTLRAWEERYRLVVPGRSGGGQRIYSSDDLADLRFVIETIAEGSSRGDAHRLLAEKLRTPGAVSRAERERRSVLKPINPLRLISTVRDLLGQSALTRPSRLSVS